MLESRKTVNIYLELFKAFFKIGLFTFGGGYGMISVIEDICVEEKAWITHDEMMNLMVIAESTPGPIAINSATFVGSRQAGVLGALVSTFGIVLPSFGIIHLISLFFDDFLKITVIANAFKGIEVAVGFLIVNAAIRMIRKMVKKPFYIATMVTASVAMFLISVFALGVSSIALIIVAALSSLIYYAIKREDA